MIINDFSNGLKLKIHLVQNMATYVLYQQVWSQYMVKNCGQAKIFGARVQESFDDSKLTEIKITEKGLYR